MSGLRIIDALTPGREWRLSVGIRGGVTNDGMQFAMFRGELYGVIIDTVGNVYWQKFVQGGFKSWDDQKVARLEYAVGTPAVTVMDDRFFVAVQGSEDKIYVVWTEDFVDWKYVLDTWSVGSFVTKSSPTLVACDARLFVGGLNSDNKAWYAIVNRNGTILDEWKQIPGSGVMEQSPTFVVYKYELYCFVAGPSNQDIYWCKYGGLGDGNRKFPGGWNKVSAARVASTMGATSHYDDKLYVSWIGQDNSVTYTSYDGKNFAEPQIVTEYDFGKGGTGMASYKGRLLISYSGNEQMNGPEDVVADGHAHAATKEGGPLTPTLASPRAKL